MNIEDEKLGPWEKWGGRRVAFEREILRAQEIKSTWTSAEGLKSIEVVIEKIDGCVEPAWGADEQWLYLRRPEGAWKTRMPRVEAGRVAVVYQKSGEGRWGGLMLGSDIKGRGGWFKGEAGPLTSHAIDGLVSAKSHGVDADEVGPPLWALISWTDSRALVWAGDGLGHAEVSFEMEGNWLIAMDEVSKRRLAYDLSGNHAVAEACKDGKLWLRWGNSWVGTIDVRVELLKGSPSREDEGEAMVPAKGVN